MATRLYFGNGTPPVSPTITTGWEVTAAAVLTTLELVKDLPDSAFVQTSPASGALNTPAQAVDVLALRAVGPPLTSGATVSGAIRGQMRVNESNAAADLDLQCVLWWMKSDGTVRGTSLTFDASALGHEFSTALRNISIPKGGSLVPTSVSPQTGDRPVLELGYRKHENAATNRNATFDYGNPSGTDLAVDETTTTQNVPWIEFTETLSFDSPALRVSQTAEQVPVVPTNPALRVSQTVEQIVVPSAVALRVSQTVVQVVIGAATTRPRSWGQVIG